MGSDFTLAEFEVDWRLLRRALEPVPGVTAVAPDDESPGDGDGGPPRAGDLPGTATGRVTAAPEPDVPGSPWPGAPADTEPEDESGLLGGRSGTLLAVGAATLGLGLLAVGAVLALRRRGGDEGSERDSRETRLARAAAASPFGGGRIGPSDAPGAAAGVEKGPTALAGERDPPVDAAPIVGLGFLAAGAALLRRIRARVATPETIGDDEAETEVAAAADASTEA